MTIERRKFLQQMAAVCGAGIARTLGVGMGAGAVAVAATGTTAAAAATATLAKTAGTYGSGVRQQVFEVIVRQAMAGAPWQAVCQGPMAVNNISEDEVKEEVIRRIERSGRTHDTTAPNCLCARCVLAISERYQRVQKRIDSLPHSLVSPCACRDCAIGIAKIRADIWEEEKNRT